MKHHHLITKQNFLASHRIFYFQIRHFPVFFLICLIAWDYTAFGQSKEWLFGGKMALGISGFNNSSQDHPFFLNFNYEAGLNVDLIRPNSIGMGIDFLFSGKGANTNYGNYHFTLQYLILSLGPNFYINRIKTIILAGGYAGLLLNDKITTDIQTSHSKDISFKPYDAGVIVSINQRLVKIKSIFIGLELYSSFGLINIINEDNTGNAIGFDNKWTNNFSVNLCLTVLFSQVN